MTGPQSRSFAPLPAILPKNTSFFRNFHLEPKLLQTERTHQMHAQFVTFGGLMSLSKLSVLAAAATFCVSGVVAHADSLSMLRFLTG